MSARTEAQLEEVAGEIEAMGRKALPLAKGPVMNAARSTANGEIITKPAVTVTDEIRD